jgi:glutathione-independent formaldehyde dehydrogenase
MKALVYEGPFEIAMKEVEEPKLSADTDAVLEVTSTAICGSDLHMYHGRTAAQPGVVLGHEIMGVISEVGAGVRSIKVGDRVVLPFNISCGFCYNCVRGDMHACLTANPHSAGAAYGYVGMGPYRGGQAERVLVPYADYNCLKLPGEPGDEWEDDFLLLADIFPTGFHATELAKVDIGDTVAIYGAGPVGLLAAYSCILKGASEVYVVDEFAQRLELAKSIGAMPINFRDGDPVEQIKELRDANRSRIDKSQPGEEKMAGVMRGIDAVGYEATSYDTKHEEDPMAVIKQLLELVNPTGSIGVIGVYLPSDPGAVSETASRGEYMLPWATIFEKALSIGSGQAPVKRYNYALRDMIVQGKATPSFIISHHLGIEEGPEAYRHFDEKTDGYTKVALQPAKAA